MSYGWCRRIKQSCTSKEEILHEWGNGAERSTDNGAERNVATSAEFILYECRIAQIRRHQPYDIDNPILIMIACQVQNSKKNQK